MAGLGAGAGAAAKQRFDAELSEKQREADMRAAQADAARAEQARQFDARMAANAEENAYRRERTEKADALALDERDYRRQREARSDALALDERDYRRGRDAATDERQRRLDALALDERDYRRQREARAEEWSDALNAQRLEEGRMRRERWNLEQQEYMAQIQEKERMRQEEYERRNSDLAHVVTSLIAAPKAQDNPAVYRDFLDKANQTMGSNYDFFEMDDLGGLMLFEAKKDGSGQIVYQKDENGQSKPVFAKTNYIPMNEVSKYAAYAGLAYDPNQRRYVLAGSTAYTGGRGGRAAGGDEDILARLKANEALDKAADAEIERLSQDIAVLKAIKRPTDAEANRLRQLEARVERLNSDKQRRYDEVSEAMQPRKQAPASSSSWDAALSGEAEEEEETGSGGGVEQWLM